MSQMTSSKKNVLFGCMILRVTKTLNRGGICSNKKSEINTQDTIYG